MHYQHQAIPWHHSLAQHPAPTIAIRDVFGDRKWTVGIAGGVLLVALAFIWSQTRTTMLTINHTLFGGIGQVAAQDAAAAVHDHGRIVAVIDGSYTAAGAAHYDEWQAFQRELKTHKGISLVATPSVEVDPSDSSTGCPSAAYKQFMEEYAGDDAIVFFVSLPDWKWLQQNQRIPQHQPAHVIVVDTGLLPAQGRYASYFANGFMSTLIAARARPIAARAAGPTTSREWFDQYFQVFTMQNFDLLADAGGTR